MRAHGSVLYDWVLFRLKKGCMFTLITTPTLPPGAGEVGWGGGDNVNRSYESSSNQKGGSLPRMGRGKMKKRKFQSSKDGEVEDEKRESFSLPRMGRWKMKKGESFSLPRMGRSKMK